MGNGNKIIFDLCGGTGSWSKPYRDAGYDVRVITLPESDVRSFLPKINSKEFKGKVYGILAAIALIMPAIFLQTSPDAGSRIIGELSVFVSVFMLIVYVASLFFILYTHKHLYTEEVGKYEPKWSKIKSVFILLLATLAVAWMSEILVGSIEPVVAKFGWTELFIGVIFVAIIGNAAEHTSAIVTAMKNRMDLALQISIGSATQIAMFVAPFLVLASLFFKTQMNLVFNTFELIAIVLSILIANLVVEDGESNWLEGVQLLMAYAIMAVAFFFHP